MARIGKGAGGSRRCSRLLGAAAVTLLGLAACEVESTARSPASLTYTEDALAAYREAMAAFEAEDWEDARDLFGEVRKVFGYSRYARLSELRLADVDFAQGKYNEAIAGYRSFIRGHRGDENVEYARYRIGKALFLDINDTLLLPPQEERDQGGTLEAYEELKRFVERYPKTRYQVDAGYMLEVVTQRLVRHELYVARYYLGKDCFEATVARVDYALEHYPGSGLDAEALVLKGETLLKMDERAEARAVFERVVREHGGPFGRVARRFLSQMGEASAPPAEGVAAAENR